MYPTPTRDQLERFITRRIQSLGGSAQVQFGRPNPYSQPLMPPSFPGPQLPRQNPFFQQGIIKQEQIKPYETALSRLQAIDFRTTPPETIKQTFNAIITDLKNAFDPDKQPREPRGTHLLRQNLARTEFKEIDEFQRNPTVTLQKLYYR